MAKRGPLWLLACAALAVSAYALRPSQRHLHASASPDSAPKAQPAASAPGASAKPALPAAPAVTQSSAPKSAELPPLPPPATNGALPPAPLPVPATTAASSASGGPSTQVPPGGPAAPAASAGQAVPAQAGAPASVPSSPAEKAKMDSLLKTGSITSRDEDSADQAEADAGPSPALPGGKPGLPFAMKKPARKEVAAFQLAVLNAVTALDRKDYPKALKVLAKAQPTERLAQVYKTILMSSIYHGLKDYAREDSVLRTTLDWVGGSTWQSYLLNRRIQAFALTKPGDSARLQFSAKVIQAPVSAAVKINFLYDLLKLQGFAGNPDGYETLLKRIVASAPADRRLDTLYQQLSPNLPPGTGTWDHQDMMIDLEAKLALYPAAVARSEAALKLVPGVPEKKRLHWDFANLLYRGKDYPKAITAYQKWMERYGETPEAILQLARCYDRQQEPKKAILWYDKLLEKFPKHEKTSEIYWMRAWDLEAAGDYEEAIEFYYRQLADFSANKRGDWANFRVGLCQYKAGNASAALQAFKAIREQVNSNAYPAGLFWEARAADSLRDSIGARLSLLELAQKYPFNFYGHMARQSLVARHAWPDSLEPWKRFAPSSPMAVKAWMKGEMSGFRDRLEDEYESEYLPLGKLLQFRLDTLAILTWRTIPAKTKNNPWFLYVNARRFQDRGLWREAYRIGLQLSYKIAPDHWGTAPKEVLRLIYPRPYEGLVQKYSAKRGLDPAFVYALMRQESGFDREIKSGAGAIGLMQMMPGTGKAVAKKEKWPRFDPYSLVEPEVNIGLGTAYLRDLKKEYRGGFHWVLANYNAGPEATKRWMAAAALPAPAGPAIAALGMTTPGSSVGQAVAPTPGTWATGGERPLDALVEDISYWETRDYVKKVMGNYWTYRILWNNRARAAAASP
jgi:soluble lytic murein transglycosylase-like protein